MTAKNQRMMRMAAALFVVLLMAGVFYYAMNNGLIGGSSVKNVGEANVNCRVYYNDGTYDIVPVSTGKPVDSLSLLPVNPLTLTYLNSEGQTKELSKIIFYVDGTLNNLQSAGPWELSYTQHFEVYQNGQVASANGQYLSSTISDSGLSATGWSNPQRLTTFVIESETLDPLIANVGNGVYQIQVSGSIALSGIFNGESQAFSTSYAGILSLTETTNSITFSAQVTTLPLQIASP